MTANEVKFRAGDVLVEAEFNSTCAFCGRLGQKSAMRTTDRCPDVERTEYFSDENGVRTNYITEVCKDYFECTQGHIGWLDYINRDTTPENYPFPSRFTWRLEGMVAAVSVEVSSLDRLSAASLSKSD